MSIAKRLHDKLSQLAPIVSVSIGDIENKSTWRIDFSPDATQGQKDQVTTFITNYDTSPDIDLENEKNNASLIARQWITNHPIAVTFLSLTPAEQETQIDGMTTPQLKELLKYLTILVSMLFKERFL